MFNDILVCGKNFEGGLPVAFPGHLLLFLCSCMLNMMTYCIEAMCCHNVTSLNKVFRAVLAEPEHEQQNLPITVSFCVVVRVSNVSNFFLVGHIEHVTANI